MPFTVGPVICVLFNVVSLVNHGFLMFAISKRLEWRHSIKVAFVHNCFQVVFSIICIVGSAVYAANAPNQLIHVIFIGIFAVVGLVSLAVFAPFYLHLREQLKVSLTVIETQPGTSIEEQLDEAGQPVFDLPPIHYGSVLPIFAEPPSPYVCNAL
ncbi:hypothetical protein L596_009790 [Steinernema carpocapsae]|uniref:Uncharacterized protein n=1 Tax=Steinernema carpocapsae TaxID=34508 RepID=A0A4U5PGD1_STECR|nr:hypothetical protein L596_009790 [Steinernema carpocapsae]